MDWKQFQAMQKVAEIGERFVSYVDEGEGDPVILIHGIPTWGYLWHKLIPVLSKQTRVLAPDLIGFGYSDKQDNFDRSIARQTEMIDAWMEKLGIQNVRQLTAITARSRFGRIIWKRRGTRLNQSRKPTATRRLQTI